MEDPSMLFVTECPEDSKKVRIQLCLLKETLEGSIKNIKIAVNDAMDKRQHERLDSLLILLKKVDQVQQKLAHHESLLREYDQTKQTLGSDLKEPHERSGLQKGLSVLLDETALEAQTVPILYRKVLDYIDDNGYLEELDALLPYATSNKRYLISRSPVHPNNRTFFSPMEHKGYFVETNQSYNNAMSNLAKLLQILGIHFQRLS